MTATPLVRPGANAAPPPRPPSPPDVNFNNFVGASASFDLAAGVCSFNIDAVEVASVRLQVQIDAVGRFIDRHVLNTHAATGEASLTIAAAGVYRVFNGGAVPVSVTASPDH
jgi:hypothetical protein